MPIFLIAIALLCFGAAIMLPSEHRRFETNQEEQVDAADWHIIASGPSDCKSNVLVIEENRKTGVQRAWERANNGGKRQVDLVWCKVQLGLPATTP